MLPLFLLGFLPDQLRVFVNYIFNYLFFSLVAGIQKDEGGRDKM